MADVFSHPWLSGMFGDPEISKLWTGETQLRHMLAFEAAWSRHGHLAQLWSQEEGKKTATAIEAAKILPEDLAEGTARDGVCVPDLVQLLKERTASTAIHTGTTSQDVIDTATALSLQATFTVYKTRLEKLVTALSGLNAKFGTNEIKARTRMQVAVPMQLSHRIHAWSKPLERDLERLHEVQKRACRVQIGGAVGDRSRLGENPQTLVDTIADELGLQTSETAWQTTRDGFAEAASLMSLISGSLGKMGYDIALMNQQGVDEITLAGGGSSSAMAHKQNPVLAELLITLAGFNATQVSAAHQALVHEQERSGSAWSLEWMVLPQMAQATGRSLSAGLELIEQIKQIG